MEYESIESDPLIQGVLKQVNPYYKATAKFQPGNIIMNEEFGDVGRKIKKMTVRPDDTWIVTFPKTGTTIIQEAVWLLKNSLNFEKARKTLITQRVPFLETESMASPEPLPKVEDIEDLPSPRVIKSHLPVSLLPDALWTVKPKTIMTYRNPKEVVYSYYHHNRLFIDYRGSFEEFAEIFLADKFQYSPFWTLTLGLWEKRNESNVLFLQFGDILQDQPKFLRTLADFLQTPLSPEGENNLLTHLSFNRMQSNPSVNYEDYFRTLGSEKNGHFIRRGKVDEWKEKMSREMIKEFDEWSSTYLRNSDFPHYY